MLRRFLLHVRKQPKATRSQYAFIIASVFTTIVAGSWLFQRVLVSESTSVVQQGATVPFANVINQTKEQLGSVREAFGSLRDGVAEVATEIEDNTISTISSSSSSSALDFTLTPETVSSVQARSTTIDASSTSERTYREVQIVTRSEASTTATTTP
jgi:hypothetical protein